MLVVIRVGRAETALFNLLESFLDTVSTSRTRHSFGRSLRTVVTFRTHYSVMLFVDARSGGVSLSKADEARAARRALVRLDSGVSTCLALFAFVYSTKSSSIPGINEPTSWAQDLQFSTPRACVLVITRYRGLRTTRAVIIDRTVYFLEAGLLVTVESTSAGLLHHSFRRTVVTRRALNRSRRTKWAVVPVDARYAVLFFQSLYLIQVSTRRTGLGFHSSSDTEMAFRTFIASDISRSHLIAEETLSTLLALVLIHTLKQWIKCSLWALEHKRIVKLLISSRWAPVTNRTGVSRSVSIFTNHTGLATSAVRELSSFSLLRISFVRASLRVDGSSRAVPLLGALSTSRVRSVVVRTDGDIADVSSSASLSN